MTHVAVFTSALRVNFTVPGQVEDVLFTARYLLNASNTVTTNMLLGT
jgi:hypothetical protein